MFRSGVEAVLVQPSLPRELAAEAALKKRLPQVARVRNLPSPGAYAADTAAVFRQSATFVDKTVKRTKSG